MHSALLLYMHELPIRYLQILKVVPYSAIQLCTYELAKRHLRDGEGRLSVPARLAAGACAGMTATLVRVLGLRAILSASAHPPQLPEQLQLSCKA